MKSIEQHIYNLVKNNVVLKIAIKRLYQSLFLIIKPRPVTTSYNIVTASNYFYGFHDKSPWNAQNNYLLAHRIQDDVEGLPQPEDSLQLGYFTNKELTQFKVVGTTTSWNWQQGAMLQWVGETNTIAFNTWVEGANRTAIVNENGDRVKTIPFATGSISSNGKYAACYDFERLNTGMKGYGYANENYDVLKQDSSMPDKLGFRIYDIDQDKEVFFLSVNEINNRLGDKGFSDGYIFVTHFLFAPDSKRFFFLLRQYIKGKRLVSKLITMDVDGNNLCVLPTGNMVSHLTWVGNDKIFAYCSNFNEEDAYYLFTDQTQEYTRLGVEDYRFDGHPQFCSANKLIVTDTYPNRRRLQELSVFDMAKQQKKVVATCFAPMRFSEEFRCDLHPRWDRTGDKICIDTTFPGKRSVAVINFENH